LPITENYIEKEIRVSNYSISAPKLWACVPPQASGLSLPNLLDNPPLRATSSNTLTSLHAEMIRQLVAVNATQNWNDLDSKTDQV